MPRQPASSVAVGRPDTIRRIVIRPQSRGGGLRIAPLRGVPSDGRRPGHQTGWGFVQFRDLGCRHLVTNDQFEALRQWGGRRMAGVARGAAPFPPHAFRVWIPR